MDSVIVVTSRRQDGEVRGGVSGVGGLARVRWLIIENCTSRRRTSSPNLALTNFRDLNFVCRVKLCLSGLWAYPIPNIFVYFFTTMFVTRPLCDAYAEYR